MSLDERCDADAPSDESLLLNRVGPIYPPDGSGATGHGHRLQVARPLEAGQVGENWVRRKDGRMERLKGCDETVIDAGEAVIIQTPTAGGYGKA